MQLEKYRKSYNNGFVSPKKVKNVIHYFCAIVEYEQKKAQENNRSITVNEAVHAIERLLVNHSNAYHKDTGVTPVSYKDSLLCYFFNQKNKIPGYVYYWLCKYYSGVIAAAGNSPGTYSIRHYKTRNELQAECIEHIRFLKFSERDSERTNRHERRKLCKLYRSGKYSTAFNLINKDIDSLIKPQDVEEAETLLPQFYNFLYHNKTHCGGAAVLAFVLGRMQGRSEAAEPQTI